MVFGSQSLRRRFLKATGAAVALGTQVLGVTGQAGTKPYSDKSDKYVRIGNEQIELVFRRDNGGLEQVMAKQMGMSLLADTQIPALSWRLR
ncbi:MAG: hypothetical protein ABEI52_08085, partial [Halobacteriaceae archaeon]